MCDDSTVAVVSSLTCLPILPFISPPGSSVVTSPRAPRQFLECLGMFSWARPGPSSKTARPAHPPSPPPCRCPLSIYRQVPSTPVYFSPPCTSFPAHTPLPIASSLNLTRLGLSSAPAQLSSARTRTSAACSCCGRHGTAGQAGFIHSRQLVAWVSRHPCAQYGCTHAYTRIHLQNIYHSGNWPGGLRRCLSPTYSPWSSYLISGC